MLLYLWARTMLLQLPRQFMPSSPENWQGVWCASNDSTMLEEIRCQLKTWMIEAFLTMFLHTTVTEWVVLIGSIMYVSSTITTEDT